MINTNNYSFNDWENIFPDEVSFSSLIKRTEWRELFGRMEEIEMFKNIEKKLTEENSNHKTIYPYPQLLFNTFEYLKPEDVKVVIIGMDPYFNARFINNKKIPEAMGVSFSVPIGIQIPSSLQNIYKNLISNHNMYNYPQHGNLQSWVMQGCLMMNTALTVQEGLPNSHKGYWTLITDKVIKHLSSVCDNVVFVLWGASAYEKIKLINLDKHTAIISSHPSGLSCYAPMKEYPAFNNYDHFGKINEFLKEHEETPIIWQV